MLEPGLPSPKLVGTATAGWAAGLRSEVPCGGLNGRRTAGCCSRRALLLKKKLLGLNGSKWLCSVGIGRQQTLWLQQHSSVTEPKINGTARKAAACDRGELRAGSLSGTSSRLSTSEVKPRKSFFCLRGAVACETLEELPALWVQYLEGNQRGQLARRSTLCYAENLFLSATFFSTCRLAGISNKSWKTFRTRFCASARGSKTRRTLPVSFCPATRRDNLSNAELLMPRIQGLLTKPASI